MNTKQDRWRIMRRKELSTTQENNTAKVSHMQNKERGLKTSTRVAGQISEAKDRFTSMYKNLGP